MKKIFFLLILLILNSVGCFSQSKTLVLEDYILKKRQLKDVSSLTISNKVLKREIQTFLETESTDSTNHDEIYNFVKNEFDYKNLSDKTTKSHNFSFKVGKQKFKKLRYSEPVFSKDEKYAIFYQATRCRKGLCGTGFLILMENNNGTWEEKQVLIAWIS
jgi:hypothetical protein